MKKGRAGWRRMQTAICILGMALVVPALLLAAFEWGALDRSHHQALYDALGSVEAAGVDKAALSEIGDMLVDYLKEDRADLSMEAVVNGAKQPVFNQREVEHMADVLELFRLERRLVWGLLLPGLMLTAIGLFGSGWTKRLALAGGIGQGFWLALAAFAAVWAAFDFNAVFLGFHRLLFRNDLWQLNPATDLMIRMLPEKFFAAVAVWAAGRMLIVQVALAALWALPAALHRLPKRRKTA